MAAISVLPIGIIVSKASPKALEVLGTCPNQFNEFTEVYPSGAFFQITESQLVAEVASKPHDEIAKPTLDKIRNYVGANWKQLTVIRAVSNPVMLPIGTVVLRTFPTSIDVLVFAQDNDAFRQSHPIGAIFRITNGRLLSETSNLNTEQLSFRTLSNVREYVRMYWRAFSKSIQITPTIFPTLKAWELLDK